MPTQPDDELEGLGATHLEMVEEDLERDELFLRVVFETRPHEAVRLHEFAARRRATNDFTELPPTFWPHDFELVDAYLTNAPSAALGRRFYL